MFNYFATLIAISPSSSQDLVVSQFPQCPSTPLCLREIFQGLGLPGEKSSGRTALCEHLLNHLELPSRNILGGLFWPFKVPGLFLKHPPGCKGSEQWGEGGSLFPKQSCTGKSPEGPWGGTWVTAGL